MGFCDGIQVRSNLVLTFRERGKIVARREGHNIWLNFGRAYLASLVCYSSYSPLTAETDHRIRYIGMGIGGTSQRQLSAANSSPMTPAYAGSNTQTDTDAAVAAVERPVRVTGGTTSFPYDAGDVWLAQVQVPTHPLTTQSLFKRVFATSDISYGSYTSVPLSEVALFHNGANPNVYNNPPVAYDTFDTISKTNAISLEVDWTLRF